MKKQPTTPALPDEKNPKHLFTSTDTDLLVQIVQGDISAVRLARAALANRGMSQTGHWVGFEAARAEEAEASKVRGNHSVYDDERTKDILGDVILRKQKALDEVNNLKVDISFLRRGNDLLQDRVSELEDLLDEAQTSETKAINERERLRDALGRIMVSEHDRLGLRQIAQRALGLGRTGR